MTYDYLVTLKKPDHRWVDQVSQIMYLFSVLVFGYYTYKFPKTGGVYLYLGAALLLTWIVTVIRKRRQGAAYFRFGLLIAAVGWYLGSQRNILMAVLYLVAALIEKQVKFPQEIGFTEGSIEFNTLPRKSLQWGDVQNVVIKDGLLTIDQKNNKLLQKEIEGYVNGDVENEFNAFCRRQIERSATGS